MQMILITLYNEKATCSCGFKKQQGESGGVLRQNKGIRSLQNKQYYKAVILLSGKR
jgi:hypothetical protein